MFSLYIDGRRAVIKEDTTFTLTLENPYYTDSGEYTYDVTLPMKGCVENQRIFGSLWHPSVSPKFLATKKWPFRMMTELFSLEGEAIVTSVTHEEVTVQLLAGNAALNFDMMGEDGERYIDEMDLGRAYDTLWQSRKAGEKQTPRSTWLWLLSDAFTADQREKILHGSLSDTECVCFPIYAQGDEYMANEHMFTHWGNKLSGTWEEQEQHYIPLISTGNLQVVPNSSAEGEIVLDEGLSWAAQPYLAVIVERILGSLGYEVKENALRTEWTKDIFVANARCEWEYAKCLPHWTISEFFDELRNAYGMLVVVKNGVVSVVTRASYYSGEGVTMRSVTDERNIDADQDAQQTDTTSGNVGYEFTDACDQWLNIGEEAYEKMEIRRVERQANIDLDALTNEQKDSGNILYIDQYTGKRYAIFKHDGGHVLVEVDQMGPYLRDEDYEVDTRLRIIPCQMAANQPTMRHRFQYFEKADGIDRYQHEEQWPQDPTNMEIEGAGDGGFFIPFLTTADYTHPTPMKPYNLQEVIQPKEEGSDDDDPNEKQEVMEVALYSLVKYNKSYYPDNDDHSYSVKVGFPYPVGVPFHKNRKDGVSPTTVYTALSKTGFLFRGSNGAKKALTDGALNIDTRVLKSVTFLDRCTDPNQVYIINGKKHVCQKIEITLDSSGVGQLKRGYFYEIH